MTIQTIKRAARGRILAAACAAATGAMGATPALAVTFMPPVVTLAPATVDIQPADSFAIITTPGTYYNASIDSALLGVDPSVSTQLGFAHGASSAQLVYQIELLGPMNPLAPPPTINDPKVTADITMADVVNTPPGDDYGPKADAYIDISGGALQMENCAGNVFTGCAAGYQGYTTVPFASVTTVNLVPNLVYDVTLEADEESGGYAKVDPTFTAPAGYAFAYSPGIGAVPEPATWAMTVLGMGVLGFALRKQARGLALARA